MSDLTIVYLTLNRTPEKWRVYHMKRLLHAAQRYPLITVSRQPMPFPVSLIDDEEPSYANIYRQLLRAAKVADTEFVATAEDDCLYSREHYSCFRPEADEFAYNRSRWSVFSWEGASAVYSLRNRISNCSLIAPRKLLIEALEERFARYDGAEIPQSLMGECGRNDLEKRMGITERNKVDFYSEVPIVHLSHPDGTEDRQKRQWKRHAQVKALDIPHWGKASDIARMYG